MFSQVAPPLEATASLGSLASRCRAEVFPRGGVGAGCDEPLAMLLLSHVASEGVLSGETLAAGGTRQGWDARKRVSFLPSIHDAGPLRYFTYFEVRLPDEGTRPEGLGFGPGAWRPLEDGEWRTVPEL